MKTTTLFILLSFLFIAFSACNNQGKQSKTVDGQVEEVQGVYTSEDTAAIYSYANQFKDMLLKEDFKGAADKLCSIKNNKVYSLTDKEKEKFVQLFKAQPIYAASVNSFGAQKNGFYKVDILFQVDKNGCLEEGRGVSTISLTFIKFGADWFMVLPIR